MKDFFTAFISGLSPKEKKILYLACVFIFMAFFDRFIVGPISQEAKAVEGKIESQTALIKKNLLILGYKEKIISEDNSYEMFYAKSDLTQDELIAAFLKEVEELAKAANVALANINPVNVEEKKGYKEYALTIECMGDMKDVINFIYGLDGSKKSIWVGTYEISPKDKNNYTVKCVISIYKIVITRENKENTVKVKGDIVGKKTGEKAQDDTE